MQSLCFGGFIFQLKLWTRVAFLKKFSEFVKPTKFGILYSVEVWTPLRGRTTGGQPLPRSINSVQTAGNGFSRRDQAISVYMVPSMHLTGKHIYHASHLPLVFIYHASTPAQRLVLFVASVNGTNTPSSAAAEDG